MVGGVMELLTHSRQQSFKTCRKKHWFSYELGIRRDVDGKALRMGSAYHDGLEAMSGYDSDAVDRAVDAARVHYVQCPESLDVYEWEIEEETVVRLLCGYHWYWGKLEIIAAEKPFNLPLVNPKTKRPSRTFRVAGKIDGIERIEDGRLVVRECKLFGEDIGPDSKMWNRLQVDSQISLYVHSARRIGYDVQSVLYDVTRKPTVKPERVPLLDSNDTKIVLDANGDRVIKANGEPRQTGSKKDGYELQTRDMTVEEWGEKLSNDIAERPDFYFQRIEIARLDQDLDEYQRELWDIASNIRTAQKESQHYRTVDKNTCSWCEFFGLCTSGFDPASLPDGFVQLSDPHPELGETYVNNESAPASANQKTAVAIH